VDSRHSGFVIRYLLALKISCAT